MPRTIIYDLKGGFGSLRKINPLYEPETEPGYSEAASSVWYVLKVSDATHHKFSCSSHIARSGQSVIQKQTPVEPGAYQMSLDAGTQPTHLTSSTVRYWSDFSRVFYHPKSLVQLYDFELDSTIRPFERFSAGTELFQSLEKDEDIVDRDFRPFAEECDRMQGIQALATLDDAWGGFATRYLDSLRDEYPKTCLWLWGLQRPMVDVPREKRHLRMSNMAQSIAHACSAASMVVPLTIPEGGLPRSFSVDPESSWHVSATFATAIESGTLESRMAVKGDRQPTSLWDIVESLNTGGNQNLSRTRMGVGPSGSDQAQEGKVVDFFGLGYLKGHPYKSRKGRVFGQLSSLRGSEPGKDHAGGGDQEAEPRAHRLVGEPVYRR